MFFSSPSPIIADMFDSLHICCRQKYPTKSIKRPPIPSYPQSIPLEPHYSSQVLMSSLWLLIYFHPLSTDKPVESALQTFAMQKLQEAIEEVNDFYLEKHGRVTAAAVKATEEKRVRLDKAGQDVRKKQALEIMLCQLMAEGDKRVSKCFSKLFRQIYLAVKLEKLERKGKGRTRAPEYYPEEDGPTGPCGEIRLSGRNGWIHSVPMNFPLGPPARAPHSDISLHHHPPPPPPLRPAPRLGPRPPVRTQPRIQPRFGVGLKPPFPRSHA